MGGIVEGHVKGSLVARWKIPRAVHGVHEGWQLEASMGSRRGTRLQRGDILKRWDVHTARGCGNTSGIIVSWRLGIGARSGRWHRV